MTPIFEKAAGRPIATTRGNRRVCEVVCRNCDELKCPFHAEVFSRAPLTHQNIGAVSLE
jgi:hypothetical protein